MEKAQNLEELGEYIHKGFTRTSGHIKSVGGELKRQLNSMEIKIDNIERYLAEQSRKNAQ